MTVLPGSGTRGRSACGIRSVRRDRQVQGLGSSLGEVDELMDLILWGLPLNLSLLMVSLKCSSWG